MCAHMRRTLRDPLGVYSAFMSADHKLLYDFHASSTTPTFAYFVVSAMFAHVDVIPFLHTLHYAYSMLPYIILELRLQIQLYVRKTMQRRAR